MCGIAGTLNLDNSRVDKRALHRMMGSLVHRGPDDEGIYVDGPVGLGFRRLSIIDLEGGHQPLSNEDGSIWIIFNGEVYNFQELRQDLEKRGHQFRTYTDTETIVHLYEENGPRCVEKLNGMFAFALWDAKRRRLVLARDRLGVKPLCYHLDGRRLAFGSEIQALLTDPDLSRELDPVALAQYLKLWYIPSPRTIFKSIRKLPPAHLLICEKGQVRLERYWKLDFSRKLDLTDAEWGERILDLLKDAVRIRLISDVPLGAFLSGGIDSSMVVALMSQATSRPVKTFSIGFDDEAFNELPYARQVAKRFGTEHYEEIVRPDAAQVLPLLARHYGEPFGDDSCIPTYYLSKMTRQHVTVALSGDGGDENFGGYPRLWNHSSFDPWNSLRGLLAGSVKAALGSPNPLASVASAGRWRAFGRELNFRLEEVRDPVERYTHAWVVWNNGAGSILSRDVESAMRKELVNEPLRTAYDQTGGWDPLDRLLYLDICTYLPDDLQVKMDIASMANSLEVRSPFLDYRLMELAAAIPSNLKFASGETKHLLRRLAAELLPPQICGRTKWGFSVPIARWLGAELRPLMQDVLLDKTFRDAGIFNIGAVEQEVNGHISGQYQHARSLWLLLNFGLWSRLSLSSPSPSTPFAMTSGE